MIYIADFGHHRIQKLTTEGKLLHRFGKQGDNNNRPGVQVFSEDVTSYSPLMVLDLVTTVSGLQEIYP